MSKKIEKSADNETKKFGIKDCVAYAAGDFGCNMSFSLKGTVQTFWLAYMMMETGLLSLLLLIVQIWDAINDPLIGAMIDSDKRKYRLGKFKTYILVGAIGLLVAGALVFLPFPDAKLWVKVALFIGGYLVWDACYTVANVPYGSMLSLVTTDGGERSQLSTWRSIGSMVGNMVPMVVLPMLIWRKEVDEAGNPILNSAGTQVETLIGERVFIAALIMGVLGFIAFLYMIKTITLRVDENSVKTNETKKFNVFKAFVNFAKNRPAVGATVAAMAMFLGMNSATTATTIMFATYFGQASLSGLVMIIGFVPMLFFMPFIKKLVDKYGKKEASAAGAGVSLLGGLLMFVFPLIPNKTLAMVAFVVALTIFGLGMGIYTCVSWAFMADAIDYNEWKFGTREEGMVYSLHSFFRKLAQGVGPSIVLLLMGALGYVSSLGTEGQSLPTAYNMCWLVAGLYVFSGVLMFVAIAFIYNLDKKTLALMNSELEARKVVLPSVEETIDRMVEEEETIEETSVVEETPVAEEVVEEDPVVEETPVVEEPVKEEVKKTPAKKAPAKKTTTTTNKSNI